jgi:hypothetical protein
MKKLLFLVGIFIGISVSYAQYSMYTPSDIKWSDAPPPMSSDVKIAILEGDPSKEGQFTIRLRLPSGFTIAPHWHPEVEHVTVISGSFILNFGDKFDKTGGTKLPAGSMSIMQPKTAHFAWCDEPTEIQLHGIGPWKIVYVNPEDDPANKK